MRKIPFEAIIWIVALISLGLYIPDNTHFTLCPFANLGFEFCPGCGLGHSISYALHGDIMKSLHAHPLGLFAILILSLRIIALFRTKNNPAWLK